VSFLSTTLIGVCTSIFIARLYGVRVVGQFALVYAPVLAVWLLSTVREQPALQREAAVLPPRHPRVTALFVAVFTFSTALTVVVAAIGAVITYFVFHGPIKQPELVLPSLVSLAGYVLITNTCVNFDSIFVAFLDARGLFWLRLHQVALFLVLVVALRPVSGSVWSLVVATTAAWFPPCIHRLVRARRWMTLKISRAEVRAGFGALPEMLRFGLKLTPATLLWGACDQVGTWVIGALSSVAGVGAYNRAWFLSSRFLDARQRLSEMLFPTLVERHGSGDREGFERALIDSLRYTTAFTLLFAGPGGGAAMSIMAVFGPGFAPASTALAILLLVPALTTIVVVLSQSLIATNRPLATSTSALIRLIATFSAVWILTKSMGITGTAIGMAVGGAAQLAGQLALVQRDVFRLFLSWWPPRQMLAQLLAYCASFAAARAVVIALPGLGGLLISLSLGVAAYLAVLVTAGGLTARDWSRIHIAWLALRARADRPAAAGAEPHPLVLAAFQRGERLEEEGHIAGAVEAYREADDLGHAAAACNLGVLLEQQDEVAGAQAAYARAERRGDANGAFNLGLLLQEQGDRAPAIAAFRRADQRGHAAAACNLGVALEEQGELAAAAAAYQRAAERGDAHGAFNLDLLRAHERARASAKAARRRPEHQHNWPAKVVLSTTAGAQPADVSLSKPVQRATLSPMSERRRKRVVLRSTALLALVIVGLALLLSSISGGPSHVAPPTTTTTTKSTSARRLFSATSIWNSPIPAGTQVDPSSPQLIGALDAEVFRELRSAIGPWIATTKASTPVYVVGGTQPTVRVRLDNPTAWWRRSLQRAFEAVPIPSSARPARGPDEHMTIWQPSTDKLWEFFHMRLKPDGWHAAWGGAIDHVSRSPGYYTRSSWPGALPVWGASATSLPVAAGLITMADLRVGVIDHALSIALPAPRAGVYARPAERSDGTGGPGTIPEGARLRLDPNLDLNSLHLPPLTRMIAEAAQRYGIVVRDQTHYGITFYAEDPTQYGGNKLYYGPHGFFDGMTPLQLLARFPWSHLQVLKLELSPTHTGAGA
jgi:O-antigen/teichoic acid export membrane protein